DQRCQLGHAALPHLLDRGGELGPDAGGVDASCALLDKSSKRAEIFPWTSITRCAFSRSASRAALRSRSRALSRSTGSVGGRPRVTANPASAPASRALRHSTSTQE